jgi:hypothetical protein
MAPERLLLRSRSIDLFGGHGFDDFLPDPEGEKGLYQLRTATGSEYRERETRHRKGHHLAVSEASWSESLERQLRDGSESPAFSELSELCSALDATDLAEAQMQQQLRASRRRPRISSNVPPSFPELLPQSGVDSPSS